MCASVFACVCLLVCMFHKGLCDIAFVEYPVPTMTDGR